MGRLSKRRSTKRMETLFFKDQDYKKALGNYHKVFCYVNGLSVPGEKTEASAYGDMMGKSNSSQVPPEKVEDLKKLKQSTHLNMAACYLKTSQPQKCINSCTKALADGDNTKALVRRGQAYLELRNLDEAKADFERAKALEPSNPAIEQELKRLKVAFKQHDQKEKERYKNMFSKMSKDEEAPTNASKDEPTAELSQQPDAVAAAEPVA